MELRANDEKKSQSIVVGPGFQSYLLRERLIFVPRFLQFGFQVDVFFRTLPQLIHRLLVGAFDGRYLEKVKIRTGLSQMQVQKSLEQCQKIPKSVVVQHKIGVP